MAAKQKTKNPKKRKTRTVRTAAPPPPHGQASTFDDFPPGTNTPNTEIHKVRKALTDMRNSLFDVGGVTADDYKTIIRIQKLDHHTGVLSASCGCGCS